MTERWGPPTWMFFHCFAEKINTPFYEKNYIKCFDIIKKICSSLPCPICQYHAMSYLKRINVHALRKKEQFKRFLFNFHNYANVNTKKKNGEYKYTSEIRKRYIYKYFKIFFSKFLF